ncbi:MAG TPA: phosphate ABC transporter permease subunit PstC [Bryobacteraceae bacterium]|nr:phosphate ABC transporter permease subunit PstC [Bryobacteraceae bacterium]
MAAFVSSLLRRLRNPDRVAHLVTLIVASSVLLITVLLVIELYSTSLLSRQKLGWQFLISRSWDPVLEDFGALPFIYGTVVTSFVALLLAVPVGVGAAIFLSELAPPRISDSLTFVVELLAAVPSVIYGLLAVFVLVPPLRDHAQPFLQQRFGALPIFQGPMYGVGLLAAGVILAVMILPFIVSISRESLLAVPPEQREAALAVGATRWEAAWQVVVPFARLGIVGSIFLALARALGETMAVTMVIGNSPVVSASLFSPGYSIAAVIANEFTEATSAMHVSALIELGLVLFALTILLNAVARLLLVTTARKGSARA